MIIHEMEQGTPEWFGVKLGVPSSSNASKLVTGTGKVSTSLAGYAESLAMEKYIGEPSDDGFTGNKYTDRGIALEDLSRADYAMTHQVEVRQVGFITDDLGRWGASTDGLVGDDGLVEFKNLIAKVMYSLILYTKQNENRTPPGYIPQLQMEMFVAERDGPDRIDDGFGRHQHHHEWKAVGGILPRESPPDRLIGVACVPSRKHGPENGPIRVRKTFESGVADEEDKKGRKFAGGKLLDRRGELLRVLDRGELAEGCGELLGRTELPDTPELGKGGLGL